MCKRAPKVLVSKRRIDCAPPLIADVRMGTSEMSQTDSENRDAMSFSELVAWAWRETPPVHRDGRNLLIHVLAVPLFVLGHGLVIAGLLLAWWLTLAGVLCVIISIAAQGFGHSLERQPVHPFTGPRDFVRRLYAEQFCNFWRFLFGGQWLSTYKARHRERVA